MGHPKVVLIQRAMITLEIVPYNPQRPLAFPQSVTGSQLPWAANAGERTEMRTRWSRCAHLRAKWFGRFQAVHRDLWDYDLPSGPSLIEVEHSGKRIAALAQPTR